MAEQPEVQGHSDDEEITPGYKPPAQATIAEIRSKDTEDESLQKYKQALLGDTADVIHG